MAEDDVEYLIFTSSSVSEGGTSWSKEADVTATMTAAELLEKLENELEASGKADEAAQPLETLYRIVAESDER